MSTDAAYQRLAEFIGAERARRYRSRQTFSTACGVGKRTIDKLETGVRIAYTQRTIERVQAGLGWEPGSIEAILEGGHPRRQMDELLRELVEEIWPQLSTDAQAMLVRLGRDAIERGHV